MIVRALVMRTRNGEEHVLVDTLAPENVQQQHASHETAWPGTSELADYELVKVERDTLPAPPASEVEGAPV